MYAVQRLTFGSRNLLAGIDMIPVSVSYTHLDVYKRQLHGRAGHSREGLRRSEVIVLYPLNP